MNLIFYIVLPIFLLLGINTSQAQEKQPSDYSIIQIDSILEASKAAKAYDLLLPFAQVGADKAAQKFGKQDTVYARMLYFLGVAYQVNGDNEKAILYYKQAVDIQKIKMPNHLKYAGSLNNLGRVYTIMGNYTLAEPLYKEALKIYKDVLGKKHGVSLVILNNLASLYYEMGNYALAEPLFKEVIEIKKEVLGENDPDYASSLNNLALLYNDIGNYTLAEPLYNEALKIYKEALGEKDTNYANTLNNLANLYNNIGKNILAEPLYNEALKIYKEVLGEKHPRYADGLNNLAAFYEDIGNYTSAVALSNEVLKIRKEVLGEKHPDYATSLNNLGTLYRTMGNYTLAKSLINEALKIRKEIFGERHPDYASSLTSLAILNYDIGNYTLAESLFKESLKIRKEVLGEKHPDYAIGLNDLGGLYEEMDNFAEAERLLMEALKIQKEAFGEKDFNYSNSLNNLAILYMDIGNYTLAETLYKEALQIRKEILGEKHPDYATSLNNLAVLYYNMRSYTLAESLYKEALKIRKEVLGEKHPTYADGLNNLATLYERMGNYTLAERLHTITLKIRKEVLGEKHPEYAGSLNNLGSLHYAAGSYALAEPLYKEAMTIRKEVLGEQHPDYVASLNNLAVLYADMGDYTKAAPLFTEVLSFSKSSLSKNFAWLSQKGKNAYWQKGKSFYEILNRVAATTNELPSATELAYQGNLISKALLLETTRELEDAIARSTDAITIKVYSELKEKRNKHVHLLSSGTGKKDILKRLEHEADSLDKILVGRMGEYGAAKRKFEITWKEVQAGLKAKEAAIEFARYYNEKDKQYHYLALILRPGYTHPKVVKLGLENDIAVIPAGKGFADLYKLIWQPMDSLLVGVETVYYSPDGYLNNISFAALCLKGTETTIGTKDTVRGGTIKTSTQTTGCSYLSDQYTLHQLSTTRYLADGLKHSKIDKSVLIFGGVDYETIPTTSTNALTAKDYSLLENISRSSTNQVRMLYLPGTQTELQNLKEVLDGNKWQVRAHSDKNASENTLKSEVKKESPSVLHIATHGFAFPEIEQKKSFEEDDKKAYRDADNPMVRCGLLFAGANHSWMGDADMMLTKTGEDGILTALEVSALPLKNTKLVVLSACETGLGKIDGSEGTFGLKRGFKLAGVQQIIVSLWSVPDKETMELMNLFYSDLAKTHDAVISFSKAQKTMRDKYADRPDLWAGFVLVR